MIGILCNFMYLKISQREMTQSRMKYAAEKKIGNGKLFKVKFKVGS